MISLRQAMAATVLAGLLASASGVALPVDARAEREAESRSTGPQRVVSLNLCADQLVLQLLERRRIASISFVGADPLYSPVAEEAAGIPLNHGQAEEVLRFNPDDLVVAGAFTSRATVHLLRRLGFEVLELGLPRDIPTVKAQVRRVAEALGAQARGEALLADFEQRLAEAAAEQGGPAPGAVIYEANGIAIGSGELAHAALEAAGLRNVASDRLGLSGPAPLPLEKLVMVSPDVLVLQVNEDAAPSIATQVLSHPALKAVKEGAVPVVIPRYLWACGGVHLAEAIARLAQAREAAANAAAAGGQARASP